LDETLSTLDDVVRSGKVRYVGISNYNGWQTAQAATWQRAVPGRVPIATTQMEYSLLSRGIEREVLPAAEAFGIGILPWSPLGRGVLTGKYRQGTPGDSRGASSHFASFVTPFLDERSTHIVDAVITAGRGLGVTPLEIALAWIRDRRGVVAPVIGARTAAQLEVALTVEDLVLPDEISQVLDEVSAPTLSYPEKSFG
jgi:aryl-alcohol dehydrogenase-like predicted oxidoreductase